MKIATIFTAAFAVFATASAIESVGNATTPVPDALEVSMGKKTFECQALPGRPQEDVRWDFETARLAKCNSYRGGGRQHWEITIPNDNIFDYRGILHGGGHACGMAVYKALSGFKCRPHNSFRCAIGEDGVAHLSFSCRSMTHITVIDKAFRDGTCNAFPEVKCIKG